MRPSLHSPPTRALSPGARLFVTGASGLLGANFVAKAAGGFRVMAASHRHRFAWPETQVCAIDLRRREEIEAAVAAAAPDVVVHLAAATNVDQCETAPAEAEELNVRVTEHVVAAAARVGAKVLFMSTDSVFDGRTGGYDEAAPPAPLNHYARTKLAAEDVVRAADRGHLVVRANIYGWNAQAKPSLAEWALQRLESGAPVPGFTDVVFAPLLANTLAAAMLALLRAGAGGTVHLASRDCASKYDFAVAVADAFGLPARVTPTTSDTVPFKAARPRNTALACPRADTEFQLARPSIREDLARFAELRRSGFASRLKACCSDSP